MSFGDSNGRYRTITAVAARPDRALPRRAIQWSGELWFAAIERDQALLTLTLTLMLGEPELVR